MKGLLIKHEGNLSEYQELLCAAAGPLFGVLYAYAASFASRFVLAEFFSLSAGLSLALSIFNILPVVPLDGASVLGVFCKLLGINEPEKILFLSSISVSTGLLMLGIYLMYRGMGYGLSVMAIILLFCTLFEEGIVKKGELI